MTEIALEDLAPTGHTSFSFYDFLPGLGYAVRDAPAANTAIQGAGKLLANLQAATDQELDLFAATLVTHGHELPPHEAFESLAQATARAFARLLPDPSQRSHRMRLTRLSLMLRIVLDRNEALPASVDEATLPVKSPWDYLADAGASADGWIASCDEDNLRHLAGRRVAWSRRAGLPTQLDRLHDGLWVGSHYGNGGHILWDSDGPSPHLEEIAHSQPLVLAFDAGTERWALDFAGGLWALEGSTTTRKLLQLPGKVHRARVVGSSLFAFDWERAGSCVRVDLDTLRARTIATGDIIICNDVCGHAGVLYGVCKLQGRVFKMDTDWTPLAKALAAGTGPGQLLDPIMVRCDDSGTLSVLNWFSAKLVRFRAF